MKFSNLGLAAALLASPASAFVPQSSSRPSALQAATDASALTEYMAKAHEDKLKAIKQAEDKKNAEIESLKSEIKALKSAPGALATTTPAMPSPTLDITDMTKEQLAQKLTAYQQFMAKYIVDAQQQKSKAIIAAEMAVTKKYEEKLKLLGAAPSTAAAAPPAVVSQPPSANNQNFDKRNEMVAAAGKAGKSRWGDMEINKATQASSVSLPSSPAAPKAPPTSVPPEVEAADHGLRADGGVGGPSLADRVNLGAQMVESTTVAVKPPAPLGTTAAPSYYDKRNAMVAAAAKAGKSRWGDMEIQKAETLAAAASLPSASASAPPAPQVTVTPEIEAADHGLRNDGGVGGPSLAQRVNLGAALLD